MTNTEKFFVVLGVVAVVGMFSLTVSTIIEMEARDDAQAKFCYDHGYSPHRAMRSKYGNGCYEGSQLYFNETIIAGRKGKAAP